MPIRVLDCFYIVDFFLIGLYIFRQYLHNEKISLISIIVLNSFFRLFYFVYGIFCPVQVIRT